MKIRTLRPLALLLLTTTLAACGDDDDPTGPDQSYQETLTGTVQAFGTTQHEFTAPRDGQMTIELTWTDDDIDLDLYLTDGDCDGYPPNDCTILAESDEITGALETVTRSVQDGDDFRIWVDNFDLELASPYEIEITIE